MEKIQGKKPYFRFANPNTNAIIYFSYLITTNEESTEEEEKGGGDITDTDFISLSCSELFK